MPQVSMQLTLAWQQPLPLQRLCLTQLQGKGRMEQAAALCPCLQATARGGNAVAMLDYLPATQFNTTIHQHASQV